jgi:predicted membrane-bound spermidine synthase
MSLFAVGFSATALLTVLAMLRFPIKAGLASNFSRVTIIYCTAALPFFCAGAVITLAFRYYAADAGRLYACDLLGAATGCLVLIPLLNVLGAIDVVLFAAAIAACAAMAFAPTASRQVQVTVSSASIAFIALLVANHATHALDLRDFKGLPVERLLFSKWNSFSHVTVRGSFADPSLGIEIDADASTPIYRGGANPAADRFRIDDLAHVLRPHGDVLVIGPGGGKEVRRATQVGARSVTAVEVNPIIARDIMSREPFRSYSGDVYGQPRVRLVIDEARSFIRRSPDHFDVLQADMVDTWAATSAGAFALTENNLYTVEAFRDYAEHLRDGGILTITRWFSSPPDQVLRLVTLTRAMMTELALPDPAGSIIIVVAPGEGGLPPVATFLFKKGVFTAGEVGAVETASRAAGFEVLYSPHTRPPGVLTALITAPDPSVIWNAAPRNIAPTYDNSPFFFNSVHLSDTAAAFSGDAQWRRTNLGTFMLVSLLAVSSVLVVVFIFAPLLLRAHRGEGTPPLPFIAYFACLGAGFMMIEIALLQKFILFLGHPVYALTVVLFSLLAFSGLGSWTSRRIGEDRIAQMLPRVLLGVAAAGCIYVAVLSPLFYAFVWLPIVWRALIAAVLLAPGAFLMGMPMPLGLRLLGGRGAHLIPWAWGVNGATSVTASVVALVVALAMGFNQALLAGVVAYLGALLFVKRPSWSSGAPSAASVPVSEDGGK